MRLGHVLLELLGTRNELGVRLRQRLIRHIRARLRLNLGDAESLTLFRTFLSYFRRTLEKNAFSVGRQAASSSTGFSVA